MVCALMVSAQVLCRAEGDEPVDTGFFIESITPHSGDGDLGALMPDPNHYEINLRLTSGMGIARNFQRTEIDLKGAAFNTGIEEAAQTAALMQIGSRTALNFTREDREVRDVLSQMMEGHTLTAMQLTQGFGGGDTAGGLTLYRGLRTDRTPDLGELRTEIQRLGISSGLGHGMNFTAGWESQESDEYGRLSQTGYQGELKMALSGGDGSARFDYLQRLVEGQNSTRRQFDIVAPFAVRGETLMAEHHLLEEITDTSEKITRKTNIVLPLGLIHQGATASYVEDTKILNDVRNQKSALTFAAPFNMLGHASNIQHISTETVRGDAITTETTVRLATQFSGGQGLVERYEAAVPVGDDLQQRRRLTIELPRIALSNHLGFAAGQVRNEILGVEQTRLSHVDLSVQPLQPLDVCAQYKFYNHADGRETQDRSVQTVLDLGDVGSLRGSIAEQERLDDVAMVLRHVELQRAGEEAGDLAMRVGYTTYGDQLEEEGAPAMLAQVSLGSDQHVGVSAVYSEYDERKLTPLTEPTTTVEVRAGNASALSMRAGFTEQASRVEPERVIGLATPAFGGALRLDYVNNPLDPRGKLVMVSNLYELGFQRTLFGNVGMDFGYKYWLPDEDLGIEQYFKLQLDGGEVDRGGKIALSFLSGHFVPYPKSGNPPASLLDLSYERRWPGRGRLIITVAREEAPELSVGIDDNVQGQLKYQMAF
jgi:hypothetical protein